ncbi:MAG TPA: amidohydrolase family protein [Phenylobacterium sp.]|nr:amidohydrolase family protein [Phenylobacterium sp.]
MSNDIQSSAGFGRRSFLGGAAAAVAAGAESRAAAVRPIPIIDAHIHLFDGTRPQGAPYLGSRAYRAVSRVSLPPAYKRLAAPTGIVGAVVVEASAWVEDNLWLLEQAQDNPFIVGVSGRLDPATAEFAEYLGRYAKNPLFRAIRASRYFTADGGKVVLNPVAVEGMKRLAGADLALDTANPTMALLEADLRLSELVPDLRIIIDHLPSFDPTPQVQPAYEALIRELVARPNIFVKLTEVYHPREDGTIVKDYETLRARLEYLFNAFGEDRVMFGTDYPNSYGVATIPEEVSLMKRFFAGKSRAAAEKYFWKNSAHVYKWVRRSPSQPALA